MFSSADKHAKPRLVHKTSWGDGSCTPASPSESNTCGEPKGLPASLWPVGCGDKASVVPFPPPLLGPGEFGEETSADMDRVGVELEHLLSWPGLEVNMEMEEVEARWRLCPCCWDCWGRASSWRAKMQTLAFWYHKI
mmetsp:Transcript_13884/g.21049  ORF Transcript_13884/g.21049 Transcript_13884/m.21049 type:complete len:137 (+) Transcript_13884:321-731(+)